MLELLEANAALEGKNTVTDCVLSSLLVVLLCDSCSTKAVWPVSLDVDESDWGMVK